MHQWDALKKPFNNSLRRLCQRTYAAARAALKARFDPVSHHTRYQAEFQACRKKATEGGQTSQAT